MKNDNFLTPQLDLEGLDAYELNIFLEYKFRKKSSISYPMTKNPYTIIYGNNEFSVTYNKEGKIIKLEACSNLDNTECEEVLKSIDNILIKKIGKPRIRNIVLFSNHTCLESFYYKDLFRINQVPNGSAAPDQMGVDHPLILQYKGMETGLGRLDSFRENAISAEIIYLLSTFSGNIYRESDSQKVWILNGDDTTSFKQMGYSYDGSNYSKDNFFIDKQAKVIPCAHLIDMYFDLKPDLKEQFITGCYWYHKGQTSSSKTISYLNYTIAMENFMPNVKDNTKKQHQDLLEEYKKIISETLQDNDSSNHLQKFLAKYENIINAPEGKGIIYHFKKLLKEYVGIKDNKFMNNLYDLRSKILHGGKTIVNEQNSPYIMFATPLDILEYSLARSLQLICEKLLINWLLTKSEINGYKIGTFEETEMNLWSQDRNKKLEKYRQEYEKIESGIKNGSQQFPYVVT